MTKTLTPIFIGGTGRSGTTVVFRTISSSPRVLATVPELRIHIDPYGAINLIDALSTNWSPYQADAAIGDFLRLVQTCRRSTTFSRRVANILGRFLRISPWRYPGLSLDSHFPAESFDLILEELIATLTENRSIGYWAGSRPFHVRPKIYETRGRSRDEVAHALGRFFGQLFSSIASDEHRFWCESSPYSILHAPKLLEMLPQAKFIHVVRCPLDVVASYKKQPWGGKDTLNICHRLLAIYQRWLLVRQSIPESNYLELKIEDVAGNPHQYLSSVAEFLEFEPESFKFELIQMKELHRERWKTEIPIGSQDQAKNILATVMEEYGYPI